VARKQDFTRYAEYELNLEELRKKRLARKSESDSIHISWRAARRTKGREKV